MSAHALASPSSAGMWIACPASVTLAAGRARPSSKYAREGTAAHKIAEMVVGGNLFPPQRISVEGEEFIVGRDMLQHLNKYIDHIQMLEQDGYTVLTEQRVHLKAANGLVWGTADCVAYGVTIVPESDDGPELAMDTLVVLDLKYGKGVPVDPDCAQLMIYALAAIETFGLEPDLVQLFIHQPRLDSTKGVEMGSEELYRWRDRELLPAVERLVLGDTTESAGPHCRWCVRQTECAAFASKKSGLASESFDDGVDLIIT